MTAIVLDSSAGVEFLQATRRGVRVQQRMIGSDLTCHVPDLCPAEVVSALRGLVVAGKIHASRGDAAMSDLAMFAAARQLR